MLVRAKRLLLVRKERHWLVPVPVALLLLWWVAAARGWVAPQTLPSPASVLKVFVEMARNGELLPHIAASLWRVLVGFFFGAMAGLLLGTAMGLSERVRQYSYPLFSAIAYVPIIGWLPLLVLWLGIGETLKYVLIAKAALVPVALNCMQGIHQVPREYREVGEVYRLRRLQLLRWVVFPAAFPAIWAGVRYGLTNSWIFLVLVELLASSKGLGYLMLNGQQLLQMDVLFVAVFAVGVIGYLLDYLLALIERHLLRWRTGTFA